MGWYIEAGSFTSFWGDCNDTLKRIRISYIIAELESDEQIEETILHEIAHALAGCEHGHDSVWKKYARQVGCTGISSKCDYSKDTELELIKRTAKYVMHYKQKIVKYYKRKPNKKVFDSIEDYYVLGRKRETIGKLRLAAYNPDKHKELV